MAEAVTFAGPAVGVDPSREAIARAPSHPCGQLRLLGGNRPSARRARRLPWHLTRAIPGHACPAFVPRTTGRRQETTGTAGVSNPQVRNRIRASPQVARSAPRTLSRWRHGFEPRWDYEHKGPGHGASPEPIGSLNRDSNAEYLANIPRRIERSECAKERARRGWSTRPRLRHLVIGQGSDAISRPAGTTAVPPST
jgi:hypothetical protein